MSDTGDRPWLALYDRHVPADIRPRWVNGVELFDAARRERPADRALLYFASAISHADAEAQAHALARALREE